MRTVGEAEVRKAYAEAFETPQGVVVWHDLLRRFGYMGKTTLDANPQAMAFNEGTRFVVLHIYAMLHGVEEALPEEGEG